MMKKKFLPVIMLTVFIGLPCLMTIAFSESGEDRAIDEIARAVLTDTVRFKGKRAGMFHFTSIEGRKSEEGARISQYLLEKLINTGSLKFVDRSDLSKILSEQELEQTGIVDTELINEGGKVLPIDLMITGTVIRINNQTHITARVLDASTGEVYFVKTAGYNSEGYNNTTDSREAIAIYKTEPDKLDRINRAYYTLQEMSRRRPLFFLMISLNEEEIDNLRKERPALVKSIEERKSKFQQRRPDLIDRIKALNKGMLIMKEAFPSRYESIMGKKEEVLSDMRKRKR